MLTYLVESLPEYVTRGERILSVLNGEGSFSVLPGRPDVESTASELAQHDKYNPDIDFDPNAYCRMDKFDAVEVGQAYIDHSIERKKTTQSSDSQSTEEK